MALQLDEKISGINCNYWKIIKAYVNYEMKETIVTLGLYVNRDSRDESVHNIIDTRMIRLKGADHDRAALYAKCKEPVNEQQVVSDEKKNPRAGQIQVNPFVEAKDV